MKYLLNWRGEYGFDGWNYIDVSFRSDWAGSE